MSKYSCLFYFEEKLKAGRCAIAIRPKRQAAAFSFLFKIYGRLADNHFLAVDDIDTLNEFLHYVSFLTLAYEATVYAVNLNNSISIFNFYATDVCRIVNDECVCQLRIEEIAVKIIECFFRNNNSVSTIFCYFRSKRNHHLIHVITCSIIDRCRDIACLNTVFLNCDNIVCVQFTNTILRIYSEFNSSN